MKNNQEREDIIDIAGYIDCIKKHKLTIIITTVLFLAAAYFVNPFIPARHTLGAVILPPGFKSPPREIPPPYRATIITARRINRRQFDKATNEILRLLNARALTDREEKAIRIEADMTGTRGLEEGILLFEKLMDELRLYYEPEVEAEQDRLKTLLGSRKEAEETLAKRIAGIDRETALALEALKDEIIYLRTLLHEGSSKEIEFQLSKNHNILLIEDARILESVKPDIRLSLVISAFSGVITGIFIGAAKDKLKGRKKTR